MCGGATLLADAVKVTLGPKAKSVLIEKKWGSPLVCNDGVTIAKEVNLQDPEEKSRRPWFGGSESTQDAEGRFLRPPTQPGEYALVLGLRTRHGFGTPIHRETVRGSQDVSTQASGTSCLPL